MSSDRQSSTTKALEQGRAALLNYIVAGDTLGFDWSVAAADATQLHARLPCPDLDGDGAADATEESLCGVSGQSMLGLYPWRKVGIPPLVDGSGNCLWYAVSGGYKSHNPTVGINGDGKGSFTIVDSNFRTLVSGVVAVIIAPNFPLSTQSRLGGGSANPCSVAGGNASLVAKEFLDRVDNLAVDHALLASSGGGESVFLAVDQREILVDSMNDSIAWITADQYAAAATAHAAQLIKRIWSPAMKSYFDSNGTYPPPATVPGGACSSDKAVLSGFLPMSCDSGEVGKSLALPPIAASLEPDGWPQQTHYAITNSDAPLLVNDAPVSTLFLMRSRPFVGQSCLVSDLQAFSMCIESEENRTALATSLGARRYIKPNPRTSNDLLMVMQ